MADESRIAAQKKAEEKHDFLRFADDANLKIDEASIRHLAPPAPDMEAHVIGFVAMAFELGDLNNPERRKAMSLMAKIGSLLQAHYEQLPADQHRAFLKKYRGADISLNVSQTPRGPNEQAPKYSIEQAIPELFKHLQSLPDDHWGWAFEYDYDLSPEGLQKYLDAHALLKSVDMLGGIYVHRSSSEGEPTFRGGGGGCCLPLNIDVLTTKLGKPYETNLPIDLVLTVRWGESAFSGELEIIQKIAVAAIDGSRFQRIWLHEGIMRRAHLLAGPPVPASGMASP